MENGRSPRKAFSRVRETRLKVRHPITSGEFLSLGYCAAKRSRAGLICTVIPLAPPLLHMVDLDGLRHNNFFGERAKFLMLGLVQRHDSHVNRPLVVRRHRLYEALVKGNPFIV